MYSQVSTTNLTVKVIRRTALRQGLNCSVFGAFVPALVITTLAGLL